MLTIFILLAGLVLLLLIALYFCAKELEDTENALISECDYTERLEKEILKLKTK